MSYFFPADNGVTPKLEPVGGSLRLISKVTAHFNYYVYPTGVDPPATTNNCSLKSLSS